MAKIALFKVIELSGFLMPNVRHFAIENQNLKVRMRIVLDFARTIITKLLCAELSEDLVDVFGSRFQSRLRSGAFYHTVYRIFICLNNLVI